VLRKRLPTGAYREVLTGKTLSPVQKDGDFVLSISEAFSHLPIALLVNIESDVDSNTEAAADGE
jgi:maltooligosyltrehalose synthase